MSERIDPVTFRVLGGAFEAIAKEMSLKLIRMSYSSIIRESEDLGAGLFDRDGREICESDSTPMFMGAMHYYIKGVLSRLKGKLKDGDIIIHNHPYHGATHSPDVGIVMPIFYKGEHIGFASTAAHLLDIGSAAPGLVVDVVDVWAEAKLFNAVKLYDAGKRNDEVWKIIRDNTRTPDMNENDLLAMISACELGKKRLLELFEKYGYETVMNTAEEWMNYSERILCSKIDEIPDGEYYAEGWLDDDGKNFGKPLKVAVTVKVKGSELTVDLTGSSPEVETAYNSPYEGTTCVSVAYIIRSMLLDEAVFEARVPQNDGIIRPLKVIAPKGTIFNPTFPRACFARFCQAQRVADCIIKALVNVIPKNCTAGNSAHLHFVSYSGFIPEIEQYWVYLEVDEGSYGARHNKDGLDSVDNLIANTRNNPIEELDMHYPLRNERYELRPDPPAAGKWRGGIGVVRQTRFLTGGFVTCEGDRHYEKDPPWGTAGGHNGLPGSLIKNPGTSSEEHLPSKVTGHKVKKNDVIQITTPSAGGYGDPFERDPELVLDDVLDEYIIVDIARKDYGVVIDPKSMKINQDATDKLRKNKNAHGEDGTPSMARS